MKSTQTKPVKNIREAWLILKDNYYFWALVAIFAMIPVVRILGI